MRITLDKLDLALLDLRDNRNKNKTLCLSELSRTTLITFVSVQMGLATRTPLPGDGHQATYLLIHAIENLDRILKTS